MHKWPYIHFSPNYLENAYDSPFMFSSIYIPKLNLQFLKQVNPFLVQNHIFLHFYILDLNNWISHHCSRLF